MFLKEISYTHTSLHLFDQKYSIMWTVFHFNMVKNVKKKKSNKLKKLLNNERILLFVGYTTLFLL